MDLEYPLTCSGNIIAWHFCYYTDNTTSSQELHVYLRVYRYQSPTHLIQIHQVATYLELEDNSHSFLCTSENLSQEEYLSVQAGDYLAAYIPILTEPLQIVGNEVPQSALFRDTRIFPQPFTLSTVPLSELERVEGGFLHLQADVGK